MIKVDESYEITEKELLRLLDKASNKINEYLDHDSLYIDDVKWGTTRFEIPIFKSNGPRKDVHKYSFIFNYDQDDAEEYGETAEMQLEEQLNEFIDEVF